MTERLFSIAKYCFRNFKLCPENIKKRFKPIKSRFGQFVLYSAAFYNWDEQGVTDNEIKNTIQEFVYTSKVFFDQRGNKKLITNGTLTDDSSLNKKNSKAKQLLKDEWEAMLVQENYQVWRKKLDRSGLYCYKVFGTFHDIPAKTFFNVQMDTEYRKKWDPLIVKLNILDKEKQNENINFKKSLNELTYFDTGNEVLQWVMKYPYPMYSREYCYIRRAIVCSRENLIVLISKSCDHPSCTEQSDRSSVKVIDYESQMVIKPHSTFDENGFDYFLTYFDDPRAYVPVRAYNWIASSGLPGFVESLHKAALQSNESTESVKNSNANSKAQKSSATTNYANKTNPKSSSSKCEKNNTYTEIVYNKI